MAVWVSVCEAEEGAEPEVEQWVEPQKGEYYITVGRTGARYVLRHRFLEPMYRYPEKLIERDHLILTLAADPVKARERALAWSRQTGYSITNIDDIGTMSLRKVTQRDGHTFPSGKYQGKTVEEVAEIDRRYLVFIAKLGMYDSEVTLWRDIWAEVGEEVDAWMSDRQTRAEEVMEELRGLGGTETSPDYDDQSVEAEATRWLGQVRSAIRPPALVHGVKWQDGFDLTLRRAWEFVRKLKAQKAREADWAARDAVRREFGWIGEVGEKRVFDGVVEYLAGPVETQWGLMYILSVMTDEGVVVYKGNTVWWAPTTVSKGARLRFSATIKAHDEYKGVKQTVVVRPKLIGA